jgi:hypothetical protein
MVSLGIASMSIWSTPEGQLGRRGEEIVCEALMRLGWKINKQSRYDTKCAPAIYDINGFWAVLADINGCKEGTRRWFEVKSKTKAEWVVIRKWEGHGIAKANLDYYSKLQEETGTEVWIMIYELSTNDILSAPLDSLLSGPSHHFNTEKSLDRQKGGNVNFPRDQFRLFAVADPLQELFEIQDDRWLPTNVYKVKKARQSSFKF